MYGSILVPTDGSAHAERAAEHAAYLAHAFDATVHLLNVVDLDAEAGPFSAGGVGEDYIERLKERGRKRIQSTESAIEERGRLRKEVVTGRPAKAILDYANEHEFELIVMGTHGRTGVRRHVLGSVAERVVSLADVPVITVRAAEQERAVQGYDDVLIPTDGSDAAAAAINHGLAIAGIENATVHAVNVVHVSAATSPEFTVPSDALTRLESNGETATEMIATRAREASLATVTEVREGVPAKTLLTYAEENDIDLVAMGTTGQTGLSRYLLGSTTERVMRHAEMPVLAVNARDLVED